MKMILIALLLFTAPVALVEDAILPYPKLTPGNVMTNVTFEQIT